MRAHEPGARYLRFSIWHSAIEYSVGADMNLFLIWKVWLRKALSSYEFERFLCWIYLFRRFCFDELLIYLLGSWGHSEWRLDLLVILTCEPKFNIFIAVLRFEKVAKSSQSIWGKKGNYKVQVQFSVFEVLSYSGEMQPTFRLKKPFQWLWPLLGIF